MNNLCYFFLFFRFEKDTFTKRKKGKGLEFII
jgi:hypothetical protein